MDVLDQVFGTQRDVNTYQMVARAVVIFIFGIAILRIAGRRAFGQQNAVDIVLSIVIGSNLSRALTGSAPFLPTLVATAALVGMYWLTTHLTARSQFARWLLRGNPVVLLAKGQFDFAAMRRLAVVRSDIEEAMRRVGIGDMERVETAVFERSGKISVAHRAEGAKASVPPSSPARQH